MDEVRSRPGNRQERCFLRVRLVASFTHGCLLIITQPERIHKESGPEVGQRCTNPLQQAARTPTTMTTDDLRTAANREKSESCKSTEAERGFLKFYRQAIANPIFM